MKNKLKAHFEKRGKPGWIISRYKIILIELNPLIIMTKFSQHVLSF